MVTVNFVDSTADEAKAFVAKYGVYINPDLAAEVLNLRQFTGALKIVLDEVVSGADMEDTCDEIETVEVCVNLDWESVDDGENGIREILKPTAVAQTSIYFRYLVRLLEERGDEAGKDAQV
eukprot:jgi/Phyca11/15559/fgenesh1_pg.PHYCAscaffold_14_\